MCNENATVALFDTPVEIACAIREVRSTGFETGKLSVAWRDQGRESELSGYYRGEDSMKYWGNAGASKNEIFRTLHGWGFCSIPDIGQVLVAGPLADWIAAALADASIFDGMSAIGMGLYSIGISRHTIRRCEEALKEGRCLLLINGLAGEIRKAREIIDGL